MSSHARSDETMERKREKEKAQRQKKCDLNEEQMAWS